ncbi:MAG: Rrf2 family transcriptional regulator [Clostridium sp.]|uniref:RrF2 family transcriptional regulator n=1 Tax=Clostridium sp. TaxID=1506 RepID=UPI002FC90DF8
MQFSVGVEYSLHCLLYLVSQPSGESIAIKDLARFQGISESYLSKAFTKLSKAGIIRSTPGVKGGYELAKNPEDISFWDVIVAIEGSSYLFQCTGILRNIIIYEPRDDSRDCPCLIKNIMHEAEEKMREHLKNQSLSDLYTSVQGVTTKKYQEDLKDWFIKARETRK